MSDEKAIPLCGGVHRLKQQLPSVEAEYEYSTRIEEWLRLGKYLPFETHYMPKDYMFRLAVYKYVYKKCSDMKEHLQGLKAYKDMWEQCTQTYRRKKDSYCHKEDFSKLMASSFERMQPYIEDLDSFHEEDFDDFGMALEFASLWNGLIRLVWDTFYAYLVIYPRWVNIDGEMPSERPNCAQCKMFDAIGPPSSVFIALSGFFNPRRTQMPDGTVVPEGIIVHENADKLQELHEHAHGYIHEAKDADKEHFICHWIDEGMADWTAINILKPKDVAGSVFLEMYDFWIVFNSLKEEDRDRIFKCWCQEPEMFDWPRFVWDMRQRLQNHRAKARERLKWPPDERLSQMDSIDKYFLNSLLTYGGWE